MRKSFKHIEHSFRLHELFIYIKGWMREGERERVGDKCDLFNVIGVCTIV